MPLLPALLLLAALTATPAADPCDLAGTYALDRDAVLADLLEDLDGKLADLRSTPPAGRFARTAWTAEREALQEVRAEASDGRIVPHVTARLDPDGTATQTVRDARDPDDVQIDTGRWTADAACETVAIDIGGHTWTAAIVPDRLDPLPSRGHGPGSGAAFVRVR